MAKSKPKAKKAAKPELKESKGASVTYRTQKPAEMFGSQTDHPATVKSVDKDGLADLSVKPDGVKPYDVLKQSRIDPSDTQAEGFF